MAGRCSQGNCLEHEKSPRLCQIVLTGARALAPRGTTLVHEGAVNETVSFVFIIADIGAMPDTLCQYRLEGGFSYS